MPKSMMSIHRFVVVVIKRFCSQYYTLEQKISRFILDKIPNRYTRDRDNKNQNKPTAIILDHFIHDRHLTSTVKLKLKLALQRYILLRIIYYQFIGHFGLENPVLILFM